jgi:hypothetical protein
MNSRKTIPTKTFFYSTFHSPADIGFANNVHRDIHREAANASYD